MPVHHHRESSVAELRCAGCGYDLRRLRPDGRCPECGRPIAESEEARRVRRRGRRCLLWSVIPLLVFQTGFIVWAIADAMGGSVEAAQVWASELVVPPIYGAFAYLLCLRLHRRGCGITILYIVVFGAISVINALLRLLYVGVIAGMS